MSLTKKIDNALTHTISESALLELLDGLKDDVQILINEKLNAIINDYDYSDISDMKNFIGAEIRAELESEINNLFK